MPRSKKPHVPKVKCCGTGVYGTPSRPRLLVSGPGRKANLGGLQLGIKVPGTPYEGTVPVSGSGRGRVAGGHRITRHIRETPASIAPGILRKAVRKVVGLGGRGVSLAGSVVNMGVPQPTVKYNATTNRYPYM